MPDMTKPFVVESDASKYASGAVLRQQDNNGDWHPCAYLSKSFSPTEHNYKIYDRELLAIIQSLTDWRHYLIGSPHKVTVLSDHQNLTYFKTSTDDKPGRVYFYQNTMFNWYTFLANK